MKVEANQNNPDFAEMKNKVLISNQARPGPLPPLSLSSHLVVDCERIAMMAAEAYCNRGNI
jgi:hypothetical protein